MSLTYPKQIALIRDDLLLMSGLSCAYEFPKEIMYSIGDTLLLHDNVLLRADAGLIGAIYSQVTVDDLQPLFNCNKLKFFAPTGQHSRTRPILEENRSKMDFMYAIRLYDEIKQGPFLLSDPKLITDQILRNTVEQSPMDSERIRSICESSIKLFQEKYDSADIGAPEHTISMIQPTRIAYEDLFRQTIGRLIDAWSTGVLATDLDPISAQYLNFFGDKTHIPMGNTSSNPQIKAYRKIHTLKNLPSVANLLRMGVIDHKEFLSIILSDEAHDLVGWLSKNLEPGVDVRDVYFQKLAKLPSKKHWTAWLRFGTVTTVSTVAAMILTANPVIAALAGIAVGAADVQYGEKATAKIVDPYHPQVWLSHIEKHIK